MKTFSPSQLAKLQSCLQQISDILGLSLTVSNPNHVATPRQRTRVRKSTVPRLTTATFSYRWLSSAPQRITLLYQHLLRAQWIAPDTNPDDFVSIFTGEPSMVKIKWIGPKSCLVSLFRVLTDKHYLSLPKSVGKWVIVTSHFIDANRQILTHLNSQRTPQKAQLAIEHLAELMNASSR